MIPGITEVNFPSYATLHQATVSLVDMGERTISTQVRIDGDEVPNFSGWELVFKGERFVLPVKEPQAAKDNTTRNSLIDLTFQSWPIYELKRYFFFQTDPEGTGTATADKYVSPLRLPLKEFIQVFGRVLNYYFPDGEIVISLYQPDARSKEAVIVDIDHTYLWDVLKKIYEAYNVRWYIEKSTETRNGALVNIYTIKVGYPDVSVSHVFEYEYKGGLLKFERQVQDPSIYNILLGRGGEKNLPYRYFKRELSEGGTTWRGDPDAIPELQNVYFDRLRDWNFRSYVQGWRTNPRRDTAWEAVRTYNTSRAASDWAYKKGHEDERFTPVEYVRDLDSINKYGELWGALDDNDEVYPTIQGAFHYLGPGSPITVRYDQIGDVSQIQNDNIMEASESAALITSLPDVKISVTDSQETSFVIATSPFRIPAGGQSGRIANVTFSPFSSEMSVESQASIDTENSYVVAVAETPGYSNITGSASTVAGLHSSADADSVWHLEFHIVLTNVSAQHPATGTFGFKSIRIMSAEGTDEWKPTFDIWIENPWGTTYQDANHPDETPQQYAERVWLPILGDYLGNEAKVVFSDGPMAASDDYEFVIAKLPEYDPDHQITLTDSLGGTYTTNAHWKITLFKSNAEYDATGMYIPTSQNKPAVGNHFFFIGIDIPQTYVEMAEKLLNGGPDAGHSSVHYNKTAALDSQKDIAPTWVVTLDKVRVNTLEEDEQTALIDQLSAGALFTTKDKRFTQNLPISLYIQSLTYRWDEPTDGAPNIVPEVEVVLSDKVVPGASSWAVLQGDVKSIQRTYTSVDDVESVVRRVTATMYLKKTGEPESSESPTTFASKLSSKNFREGQIGGAGWGIYTTNAPRYRTAPMSAPEPSEDTEEATESIFEVDHIRVRKSLTVNELIASHTTHVGGKRIQSAAAIECTEVVDDGNNYVCYFDQKQDTVKNMFIVGDIAMIQVFSPNGANIVRYSKRTVTAVAVNYVCLAKETVAESSPVRAVNGSGVPEPGDILIQYGNYTNASRQYVIVEDVYGGGYQQMISGLDSVDTDGSEYYFAGRQSGNNPRWFVGDKTQGSEQYIEYADGKLTLKGIADFSQGGNSTTIAGNFVQSGEISLGQSLQDGFHVFAGMSGIYSGGIAAWYGGEKLEKSTWESMSAADRNLHNYAKSLFRFDGSGYLASNRIYWDASGYGGIPGVSWTQNGQNTDVIISGNVKFVSSNGNDVSDLMELVQKFDDMFTRESDGNGGYRIKANYGLYTEYFLASGTPSASGGGGGGGSTVSWNQIQSSGTEIARITINGVTTRVYTPTVTIPVQSVAGLTGTITAAQLSTALNLDNKVDKEQGKGLSTEDYTTAEKAYLSADHSLLTGSQTAHYVFAAPSSSAGAPAFRLLVASDIPTLPQSKITGLSTALSGKVNTEEGKGLSSNDYTDAEKTKLGGIAEGATANIGTVTQVKVGNVAYDPTAAGVVSLPAYQALQPNATTGDFAFFNSSGQVVDIGYSRGTTEASIADNATSIIPTGAAIKSYCDSNLVHIAGAETITGQKTFSTDVLPNDLSVSLGSTSNYWKALYLKSGGEINVGSTNVAQFTANTISTKHIVPLTNQGFSLGSDSKQWANITFSGYLNLGRTVGTTNQAAAIFGSSSDTIYVGSWALANWGRPMGYYAYSSHTFNILKTDTSQLSAAFTIAQSGVTSKLPILPSGTVDLGGTSAFWNNVYATKYYLGDTTNYLEKVTSGNNTYWHLVGNLVVDGYVASGAASSSGGGGGTTVSWGGDAVDGYESLIVNGNRQHVKVALQGHIHTDYQTVLSASNKLNPDYITTDATHRWWTDALVSTLSGKLDASALTNKGSASLPVYFDSQGSAQEISSLDLLSKSTGYVKAKRFYLDAYTYLMLDSDNNVKLVTRSGKGFYTEGFIASGAASNSGGGGGGSAVQWGNESASGSGFYQLIINGVSAHYVATLGHGHASDSWFTTALGGKATDSDVVHLAGPETISGIKTFSANILPSGTVNLGAADSVWSNIHATNLYVANLRCNEANGMFRFYSGNTNAFQFNATYAQFSCDLIPGGTTNRLGYSGNKWAELHVKKWYPKENDTSVWVEYNTTNGEFTFNGNVKVNGNVIATGQVVAGQSGNS